MTLRFVFSMLIAASAAAAAAEKKRDYGKPSENLGAYQEQISSKGKERGHKEFTYKQTPQGELKIFFALPQDWSPADKRPVVIFFYGGSWSSGNVFSFDEQSEYFAKCGVLGAMADYRVRTRHGVTPDKCVEDARSAVRWVRAHCAELGVDPGRVIAGGGSAGGHIAACTAVPGAPDSTTDDLRISCIPDGLLLCYPVASFVDDTRAESFKQVLGAEMAEKLSPARRVSPSWPPTVLFFGNTDKLLPNGVLLHNKAKEAGVTTELYLAEGQGHAFVNMAPWNLVTSKYAAEFFMRVGLMPAVPLPESAPDKLVKYNGEPVEKVFVKTAGNPTRAALNERGRKKAVPPAATDAKTPASPVEVKDQDQ